MGSVEVFPRAGNTRTNANAWRASAVPGSGVLRVREASLADYAAIRALHRSLGAHVPPCTLRHYESRLHAFPAGQMVALCDGQVAGVAYNVRLHWDGNPLEHSWRDITGDGFFSTHDAAGETLYAAELFADTRRHGFSIERVLNQARRRLCRRLDMRRIVTAARLAGYGELADMLSPELYVMRVIWGDIPDATLRFHMAQGFQYCGILRNHRPEDVASGGHAALLAWLNPLYAPPGPPAIESERARKCA